MVMINKINVDNYSGIIDIWPKYSYLVLLPGLEDGPQYNHGAIYSTVNKRVCKVAISVTKCYSKRQNIDFAWVNLKEMGMEDFKSTSQRDVSTVVSSYNYRHIV